MKLLIVALVSLTTLSSFAAIHHDDDTSFETNKESITVVADKETGEACYISNSEHVEADLDACEGEALDLALAMDTGQINQTALVNGIFGAVAIGLSCATGAVVAGGVHLARNEELSDKRRKSNAVIAGAVTGSTFMTSFGVMKFVGASLTMATSLVTGSYVACGAASLAVLKFVKGEE